ncbi:hypothetical protein ZWY2020_010263 [Hordeum vulgare]|nr:hypothetical protein ZWY2020_010263 [Hordeum vulgare]
MVDLTAADARDDQPSPHLLHIAADDTAPFRTTTSSRITRRRPVHEFASTAHLHIAAYDTALFPATTLPPDRPRSGADHTAMPPAASPVPDRHSATSFLITKPPPRQGSSPAAGVIEYTGYLKDEYDIDTGDANDNSSINDDDYNSANESWSSYDNLPSEDFQNNEGDPCSENEDVDVENAKNNKDDCFYDNVN